MTKQKTFKRQLFFFFPVILLTFISGCGGGSDDPQIEMNPELKGIAAAGSPIFGNATVKDADGSVVSVPIDEGGNFNFGASNLTSPYILFAEGVANGRTVKYFSATEDIGNINISPITDLILRNTIGIDPQTAYDNWTTTSITQSQLDAAEAVVQTQLSPLLDAMNVLANVNLLTTPFTTNHTGIDAVLDSLNISYNGNIATITNLLTNSSFTDDTSIQGDGAGLPNTDTAAVESVLTDQIEIDMFWQSATVLYSTQPSTSAINDWFNSHVAPDFLTSGLDRSTMNNDWVNQDGPDVGTTFKGIIVSPLAGEELGGYSKGYTIRLSDYIGRGESIDRIVYDGSNWLWFGNREWLDIFIQSIAYKTYSATGVISSRTTLEIDIEDDSNYALIQGVRSILVNGPGLPANLLFSRNVVGAGHSMYQGPWQGTNDYVYTDDADIVNIPDNAEYELSLCSETPQQIASGIACTVVTTFTRVVKRPPVPNAQLGDNIFAVLTSHNSHDSSAFNFGGPIEFEWTIPPGAYNFTEVSLDWPAGVDYFELGESSITNQAIIDTTGLASPSGIGVLTLTSFDIYGREYKMLWELGPGGSGGGGGDGLAGTSWSVCYLDDLNGRYINDTFNFIGNASISIVTDEYAGTDVSCTGSILNTNTSTGTYFLGDVVQATGGEDVWELDIVLTQETAGPIDPPNRIYTIAYINGNDLYFGIFGDPVLNGSTPETRPLTLGSTPLVRQ